MDISKVVKAFNKYLPRVDGRIVFNERGYIIELLYQNRVIELGKTELEAISTMCFIKGTQL